MKTNINPNAWDSMDIFGWSRYMDDYFWAQYYLYLLLYPDFIRPYASEVMEYLGKMGHKIYIISARQDSDLPSAEKRSMSQITKGYLVNGAIPYDELILTSDKWKVIDNLNINIMIEDNPTFFKSSANSRHIPLICFDTPYNQNICAENIYRVCSWYEILIRINHLLYKEDINEN